MRAILAATAVGVLLLSAVAPGYAAEVRHT